MTPIDEPSTLGPTGTPPMVAGAKWIRGTLAGKTVVDSRDFMFVWEVPYWPWWFFHRDDIAAELAINLKFPSIDQLEIDWDVERPTSVLATAMASLARKTIAAPAGNGICATGIKRPKNMPSAKPMAMPLRLKCHSRGWCRAGPIQRNHRLSLMVCGVGSQAFRRFLMA